MTDPKAVLDAYPEWIERLHQLELAGAFDGDPEEDQLLDNAGMLHIIRLHDALAAEIAQREAAEKRLSRAVSVIRSWHGMGIRSPEDEEQAWQLYLNSPEMLKIRGLHALAATKEKP